MTDNVTLVKVYLDAVRAARESGSPDDWNRVRPFVHNDLLVRTAGNGSGDLWRTSVSSFEEYVERLSRVALRDSDLETETITVFGEGDAVAVEQVSRFKRPDGTHAEKPHCFIFRKRDGRIASVSAYRNDPVPTA
jgi:ketosteroid isomerase-like protein